MSRDMKPKKPQAPKKKSGGGTLIGMFIGLIIGVAIAAGVVFYLNKSPLPFVAGKAAAPEKADSAPPAKAAQQQPAAEPMALPGKPGDPVPEKRFQFYDILPGKSAPVTEPAAPATPRKENAKEEPARDDGRLHFLQAGAFSRAQEADNLKANLAMMGIEAVVQQVMIQDKTFYRVRVGPYTRLEDANKVRAELARTGIDASLVKKEQ